MSKKLLLCGILAALAIGGGLVQSQAPAPAVKGKYLIILQAGKDGPEALARALHALLYTSELKEAGHAVALIFDGAGAQWAEEWSNPDSTHRLAPLYRQLTKHGVTQIVCDYCAGAYQVKDRLAERPVTFGGEYQGHPSIAKWADQGYQILTL